MALLAYLAVNRQVYRRDSLALLFWEDSDQSGARAALRRTLSVLHKAMGENILEVTRETLSLPPEAPFWFDVTEFRRLLAECDTHGHAPGAVCPRCLAPLSEAARLYRGDFMAGFTLRDSPQFDDWQFFQTESLRRELAGALERLAHTLAVQGDFENAIVQARRRLALDPLHEPAHRQLIQLYAWGRQHAAALRQYQECKRILDEELGVTPMQETTQLYLAIKEQRGSAAPERIDAPSPESSEIVAPVLQAVQELPLVGRQQELATIEQYYAGMQADGDFLVIEGEAGIGKTRLAEEFLAQRRARGTPVITARCYSGEAYLAYAPFIGGLHTALEIARPNWHQPLQAQWIAEAARLLPEFGRLRPLPGELQTSSLPEASSRDSPGAQTRFFEGMSQVVLALCGDSLPGILFFDDLQWADEASLDLLTYLVRRLRGRRLFVLATWREEDIPPDHRLRKLLADAQRNDSACLIALSRLDSKSVWELVQPVAAELGVPAEDLSRRLFEETEGLPFFIAEYLASLPEAAGMDVGLESEWTMPQGVRDILHSRLEAVDEAGRQLLQTAAVIGRSFDFETLQEASGRSEEETAATLEALLKRGLVREAQPSDYSSPGGVRSEAPVEIVRKLIYDFSHDKMRTLVYADASQARRRILHQRVADSLLRHTHSRKEQRLIAGQIAAHYRQGGHAAEAAEFSKIAGEHARSVYANAEALAHFQIALALGHPDFIGLEEAIGDLFTLLGKYKAALSGFESAASHQSASSQDVTRLRHKMGNVYHRLGEWEQAESYFQVATQGMAGADLSRLYADWSRTIRRQGQTERALQMALQALELAEGSGDALALAQAHNILGMLQRNLGNIEEAIRHLQESLALAEKMADPGVRTAALNNLSLACADHGELERALGYAHTALELCTLLGDRHREAALHSNLADLYHAAGLEQPSMAHLKQAVVIFSEIGAGEADRPRPEVWKLTEW